MSPQGAVSPITIHSLDDARAALDAAPAGIPVRLHSPPGAAGHQGIGWWQALLRLLAEDFPGREVEAVLDCGDSPGLALAALRAGVTLVRVRGLPPETADKLADIAGKLGSRIQMS